MVCMRLHGLLSVELIGVRRLRCPAGPKWEARRERGQALGISCKRMEMEMGRNWEVSCTVRVCHCHGTAMNSDCCLSPWALSAASRYRKMLLSARMVRALSVRGALASLSSRIPHISSQLLASSTATSSRTADLSASRSRVLDGALVLLPLDPRLSSARIQPPQGRDQKPRSQTSG